MPAVAGIVDPGCVNRLARAGITDPTYNRFFGARLRHAISIARFIVA
jgi:hypothetical protein